jgi:hypothetical protein
MLHKLKPSLQGKDAHSLQFGQYIILLFVPPKDFIKDEVKVIVQKPTLRRQFEPRATWVVSGQWPQAML